MALLRRVAVQQRRRVNVAVHADALFGHGRQQVHRRGQARVRGAPQVESDLAFGRVIARAPRQSERIAEMALGAIRYGRALIPKEGAVVVAQARGSVGHDVAQQRLALGRPRLRRAPRP
jgi:hypothetical protein